MLELSRSGQKGIVMLMFISLMIGILINVAALNYLLLIIALMCFLLYTIAISRLPLWCSFTFISLLGYITLNYGFANFSIKTNILPIPIGHLFCFIALGLAIYNSKKVLLSFLREPMVKLWVLLFVLTVTHLIYDIPHFGAYAIRDASFVVEGCFMFLGYLWSKDSKSSHSFLILLFIIFLVNIMYTLTFPIKKIYVDFSPISGIFLS
ncbi:hypothetical protein DRP53_06555, partial [candidate division WOR-3 bacterium]